MKPFFLFLGIILPFFCSFARDLTLPRIIPNHETYVRINHNDIPRKSTYKKFSWQEYKRRKDRLLPNTQFSRSDLQIWFSKKSNTPAERDKNGKILKKDTSNPTVCTTEKRQGDGTPLPKCVPQKTSSDTKTQDKK